MRASGIIAALVVAVDQLTKHWAVNTLDDRTIDVVGSLRFNLAFNSGMAFGRGQGFGPIIGILALVVIVGLLVSLRRGAGRVGTLAVGLVVGGALGNILDRLFRADGWFRGAVVDFIDLQWWPVFNVADMGVTIGGVLLVLGTVIADRRDAAPSERVSPPDASETAG
jgi:signal peptidase II